MTEHIRDVKKRQASGENTMQPIYDCVDRMADLKEGEEMTWIPVFVAELTTAAPTAVYNSSCFGTFNLDYAITSPTSFDVTLTLGDKKSMTCHEYLMFANTEAWHMEVFYGTGTHVLTFNMPTTIE